MNTGLSDNDPQVCAVCGNPIHFQTGDGWRRFTCRAGFNPRTGRWTKSCRRAFDVALALKADVAGLQEQLADERGELGA